MLGVPVGGDALEGSLLTSLVKQKEERLRSPRVFRSYGFPVTTSQFGLEATPERVGTVTEASLLGRFLAALAG